MSVIPMDIHVSIPSKSSDTPSANPDASIEVVTPRTIEILHPLSTHAGEEKMEVQDAHLHFALSVLGEFVCCISYTPAPTSRERVDCSRFTDLFLSPPELKGVIAVCQLILTDIE